MERQLSADLPQSPLPALISNGRTRERRLGTELRFHPSSGTPQLSTSMSPTISLTEGGSADANQYPTSGYRSYLHDVLRFTLDRGHQLLDFASSLFDDYQGFGIVCAAAKRDIYRVILAHHWRAHKWTYLLPTGAYSIVTYYIRAYRISTWLEGTSMSILPLLCLLSPFIYLPWCLVFGLTCSCMSGKSSTDDAVTCWTEEWNKDSTWPQQDAVFIMADRHNRAQWRCRNSSKRLRSLTTDDILEGLQRRFEGVHEAYAGDLWSKRLRQRLPNWFQKNFPDEEWPSRSLTVIELADTIMEFGKHYAQLLASNDPEGPLGQLEINTGREVYDPTKLRYLRDVTNGQNRKQYDADKFTLQRVFQRPARHGPIMTRPVLYDVARAFHLTRENCPSSLASDVTVPREFDCTLLCPGEGSDPGVASETVTRKRENNRKLHLEEERRLSQWIEWYQSRRLHTYGDCRVRIKVQVTLLYLEFVLYWIGAFAGKMDANTSDKRQQAPDRIIDILPRALAMVERAEDALGEDGYLKKRNSYQSPDNTLP